MRVDEIGIAVRADNVVKGFRQGDAHVPVLRGLSLEIATGEFVAIMGPSGSGKSTLLHVLAGLELPDSGSVVVAGRALDAMTDDELTVFRRRHVGIVFQSFNLVSALTAEENVILPLRLEGTPARVASVRASEMLAAVGMLHRRSQLPDRLSGGEAQRVAIARALVAEPALILADEPTGSLDSRASQEVLDLLCRASNDLGKSIVLVTHDPTAAAYAGRIVRVVDGLAEAIEPVRTTIAQGAASCPPGAY